MTPCNIYLRISLAGINFFRDLPNKEEEFDAIDMPFSTPGAAGQEVPLSSTYHRINLANRDQYVQSALDYRLHEFDFQVSTRVGEGGLNVTCWYLYLQSVIRCAIYKTCRTTCRVLSVFNGYARLVKIRDRIIRDFCPTSA